MLEKLKQKLGMNKAGQFGIGDAQGLVGVMIAIGVTAAIGLYVLSKIQDKFTADTEAYNATGEALTAVADIPTWLAIIVVVVMAVIILGLIGKAFAGRR